MQVLNLQDNKKAPLYVILAGMCWGIIGIFARKLSENGFSSIQLTASRCAITAILLTVYLVFKDREKLKIDKKDIWYFIGTGIGSIIFFNIFYFMTIQETTLSIASILLYTAPCFVVILSSIIFKERITLNKILALLMAFIGCVLITGIIGMSSLNITSFGILTGLGSGICYALYSIFGGLALKKYDTLTVTVYTFIVASVSILPFSNMTEMIQNIVTSKIVLSNVLLLGIVSTLVPFLLYTLGLKNMEAGKASVMAFVEPMVATIVGIILFGEQLNIQNIVGIILIFMSIILLNLKKSILQLKKLNEEASDN